MSFSSNSDLKGIFKGIFLSIFIISTVFLIMITWNIQHSCQPMIGCPSSPSCKTVKSNSIFCKQNSNRWDKIMQKTIPFISKKIPFFQR